MNVQAEFRHRDSEEGDLAFNFDPNDFLPDKTVEREQDTVRFGLRYSPTPHSNFLFSFIHSYQKEELVETEREDPLTTALVNSHPNDDGDQFEGQYIYQREQFNLVAGLAYSNVDSRSNVMVSFLDRNLIPIRTFADSSRETIAHPRGYLYSNITFPDPVTWTFGFSYDDYEGELLRVSSFNPKFGVQWEIAKGLRLRAAAFQTVKPVLVNNRTLEPTQVAGFNQFFDDPDATDSPRYGGGIDWQLTRDLYLGGEITWRDLDEPVSQPEEEGSEAVALEDRDEQLYQLYLYWTPMDQLAMTAGFASLHKRSGDRHGARLSAERGRNLYQPGRGELFPCMRIFRPRWRDLCQSKCAAF